LLASKWKPHSESLELEPQNNQHLAIQLGQLKWSVHVDSGPVLVLFSAILLSRSNSCGLLQVGAPTF